MTEADNEQMELEAPVVSRKKSAVPLTSSSAHRPLLTTKLSIFSAAYEEDEYNELVEPVLHEYSETYDDVDTNALSVHCASSSSYSSYSFSSSSSSTNQLMEQPYSEVLRYLTFDQHENSTNPDVGPVERGQMDLFGIPLIRLVPRPSSEQVISLSSTLKNKGNELTDLENYTDALKCFDMALEYDPENGLLHELKAQVFLVLSTPRLALLAVKSALVAVDLLPEWEEGHLTLARCQLNMGEIELAIRSFRRAESLDTANSFPEIKSELLQAQELFLSIEKEKNDLKLDRGVMEGTLPPLRRQENDYEEVERCLKNLTTRPGYCANPTHPHR